MIKLLNCCKYYMGCISEGGCLGPKRRQRDVYAELVDSIHQQARKIQFTDNINIYSAIRQKLAKKGYLRKLLDNLTSHKANINECLSHNLRLTTQSQHIQNKYAGLIVLNQITTSLYQQKKASQIYQDKTFIKTSSSQGKMLATQENQKDRYTTVAIDLRAQTQFFRLVTHLLQNQGRMYSKTLQSIIKFCQGRKESFGCRSEVWRVLELILKKIQRGLLVDESARAYLALIEQLRESNQDQIDYQDVLLAFLRLWLVKSNQEIYEGAEVNLQIKYEQILKVLVRRSISSSKPNVIYRSLFNIYESQGFSGTKMLACEDLLISIIKQNDLHSPVIRGLFVYMLQYLSNTNARERSASWRSSIGDQFHLGRYPKIMDKKGRLHAFETLRRWAQKGYFNIEQYINFGSSALVQAFTANLSLQKQYGKQIVRQFLKLTQPLKSSTNLILINLLMEEIKYQSSNDGLRLMLITLVREVVGERKLLQQSDENFPFFIPLDATFARDTRLQLIQLMGFIAKRIPKPQFQIQENIKSQFTHNLCEFFHSIYEGLLSPGKQARLGKKAQDDQILFRYQFANSIISFMKCLYEKGSFHYILSFISALVSSLSQTIGQQKVSIYFLLYVIYQGMHLLNSKQKLPDKMMALNFKLAPSVKALEIKGEIQGVVDYLMGSRAQNIERLVATFRTSVESLREFAMISQKMFNQVNVSFADYFKENKHKGSFYIQTSKNQFKRNSLNGSCKESSVDQSRLEQDESFKDVLDKIVNI